jgi:hypothetical protein
MLFHLLIFKSVLCSRAGFEWIEDSVQPFLERLESCNLEGSVGFCNDLPVTLWTFESRLGKSKG